RRSSDLPQVGEERANERAEGRIPLLDQVALALALEGLARGKESAEREAAQTLLPGEGVLLQIGAVEVAAVGAEEDPEPIHQALPGRRIRLGEARADAGVGEETHHGRALETAAEPVAEHPHRLPHLAPLE